MEFTKYSTTGAAPGGAAPGTSEKEQSGSFDLVKMAKKLHMPLILLVLSIVSIIYSRRGNARQKSEKKPFLFLGIGGVLGSGLWGYLKQKKAK